MFKSYIDELDEFITSRNWNSYHHIKNLTTAHSCEVAELMELFTLCEYKDHLKEVKEEIGDCFLSLFTIFRVLSFDIHKHFQSDSLEKRAFETLSEKFNHSLTPEVLVKYLVVRAGFLQEAFLWISEEESRKYINTLPEKTLLEPFTILLALCYSLDVACLEIMYHKFHLVKKKYSSELAINEELLHSMNKDKIQKRGK